MTVGEVRKICDGEPIQLNGGYFAAVLERDKIEIEESEEK